MAEKPRITIPVTIDASQAVRVARIIAKHLTALADELDAPDVIFQFPSEMTAEQATEFRKRFRDTMGGGQ